MSRWRAYWRAVAFLEHRKRSRLLKRLHEWREDAEDALASQQLSGQDTDATRHVHEGLVQAIDRIHRQGRELPMAWAGDEFTKYHAEARTMLEALIVTIDEHRAGALTDDQLHTMLRVLEVDPTDSKAEVPEATRDRIRAAARTGEPVDIGG